MSKVLRVMCLTHIRGLILFSNCARLSGLIYTCYKRNFTFLATVVKETGSSLALSDTKKASFVASRPKLGNFSDLLSDYQKTINHLNWNLVKFVSTLDKAYISPIMVNLRSNIVKPV